MTSRTLKLSEISKNASRSFDYRKNPSVVFVNTGDVLEGEFLHSNITDTKKVKLPGQAKKAIKKGDILYSEIRPGNKRYVYIDKDLDNYVVSTKFMVIESNEEIVDSKFLYYCLTENKCEETFKAIADSRSGTFPQITFDSIAFYEFTIPSKDEQKAFVYIADNIANKIRNNNKINQHLESLAQTIFKSWFVDFDPVHAKKNALEAGLTKAQAERSAIAVIAGLCSPTEYADNIKEIEKKLDHRLATLGKDKADELKTTASLFPGEFEDSELGFIPKGWQTSVFSDHFEVRDGTHDSPKPSKTGYPLVTSKNILNGVLNTQNTYLISSTDYENINKRSRVNFGDILISMIGTVGEILLVLDNEPQFAIKNIGLFKTSQNIILKNYIYLLLKSTAMKNFMESRLAGTTQKYLSLKELRGLPIVIPNQDLINNFNNITNPILSMIKSNLDENKSTSKLRDLLLPKMLTGEVDLSGVLID